MSNLYVNIQIIIIFCKFILINNTVDMEIYQFEYISNHLTPLECKRLIAAIHYHFHQLNEKELDIAEDAVPDEMKCLDLLLEWNSAEQEGKSQTHEIVCLRLRQLGHPELATWLANNVYKNFEQYITPKEFISEEITSEKGGVTNIIREDDESWSIFITIEHIILMTIFILILQTVCPYCCNRFCYLIKIYKKKSNYNDAEKESVEKMSLIDNYTSEESNDDTSTYT